MTLFSESSEQLFHEALELPADARERFLDERCGRDTALRAELDHLLRADTEVADTFLERAAELEVDVLEPGTRLGRYTVQECIGEGGMGTVYAARQESPQRDVALKVIRPDRLSAGALRRFRHEAEILGSLQHAGIAQVFEAGTAEVERADGSRYQQPFLVMELVRGVPLLDYVQRHALDRRSRIELLARVSDAVHHAHLRGVVHRDLKPENVLVADSPDSPAGAPKVLDFGIARMAEPDSEPLTRQTRAGQLIGSLASMSPEQVRGDTREVDARTDVYALGVLLYRLLAGRFPIDIEGCSVPEAVRRISAGDPPRLSSVESALRGDLTVIAARALEVEADRRYASAADLAADLRRHLEGRPIVARTDSALYVLGKTLRRHRTFSVAAATVLVLLVAFAVVSSIQAKRLGRELTASTIERGRLLGVTDNFLLAEEMLWRAYLDDSDSRHAYWALWELYARNPCLGSWPLDVQLTRAVAFHPDGALFASGRGEPGLLLWDAQGGGVVDVLETESDVESVAFHPDGQTLAVGASSGTVSLWSLDERRLLRRLELQGGPVLALRYAPDGSALAAGSADGSLRIFEPETAALITVLEGGQGHAGAIRCLAFRSDGELLASAGNQGEILLWRNRESPPVARLSAGTRAVRSLAFSEDGATLAAAGDGIDIVLWDVASESERETLTAPNGAVRFLTFHPRSPTSLLASGWWEGVAWDVESGAYETLVGHGFHHGALSASCDRLAAVAERHLRLWDLDPTSSVRLGELEGGVIATLSPDRSLLVLGDSAGRLRVLDASTRRVLVEHELERGVATLSMQPAEPASESLLAVGFGDSVQLMRPLTGEVVTTIEDYRPRSVASVVFSPDGTRVAVTERGRVRLCDVSTGETLRAIQVTPSQALGIAFSPDGRQLATTFRTYRPTAEFGVRVWSAESGELLWESLTSPTMFGQDSALDIIPWRPIFSDDGTALAAGGWGNLVLVWNAASGAIESVLRDHRAVVWDVAFQPGSSDTLASVSDDGTVKLWDVANERCLVTLVSPADGGRATGSVSFGPAGETLIVGGYGGATIWDLTYFDRHVAGNLPFQLARFGGGPRSGAAERLTERAREVLARPWPRFVDVDAGAAVGSRAGGKSEAPPR